MSTKFWYNGTGMDFYASVSGGKVSNLSPVLTNVNVNIHCQTLKQLTAIGTEKLHLIAKSMGIVKSVS